MYFVFNCGFVALLAFIIFYVYFSYYFLFDF